ncbi:InlB B-repeat-containing protein, partial [Lactococcus lactis]
VDNGVPTRSGYTFTGWNTSADGSGTSYAPGADLTLSNDTTLYAQWKESTSNIIYDANGGTYGDGSTSSTDNNNGNGYSVGSTVKVGVHQHVRVILS